MELSEEDVPEIIVFLVNADQISALSFLADYDTLIQDNVTADFASGCAQSILYAMIQEELKSQKCTFSLTL